MKMIHFLDINLRLIVLLMLFRNGIALTTGGILDRQLILAVSIGII